MDIVKLSDMNYDELCAFVLKIGQPKFRAKQIFQWIGRGVEKFEEMSDLPLSLRNSLEEAAIIGMPQIEQVIRSKKDETIKFALKLFDGNIIESVLMQYHHGYSICISSQVGCRMGCKFCASKQQAFVRNLSAGEMFGQVSVIQRYCDEKIGHVVVMGVGEPFDNYENCLKFASLLHENSETNIGYRKVTISTSGLVPNIVKLANEGLPIGLSVSLHAPNDRVRDALMPVNRKYSIDKLLEGCKIYTEKTKRRVTFEYALIADENSSPKDALELANRLKGMLCHVNLIPINKTDENDFRPPSKEQASRFESVLKEKGIEVTVRRELGADINAACGQLRNRLMQEYSKNGDE